MLQNQRACQLVRSQTGCEPLALAVTWGARTAGRCAAGVLGAVKHQRFSDQQLETFAARAPGICPKPVCDAGEPCPLPPQDDAVDVSVIVPVHNFFLVGCALAVVVGRSRDFVEYFMYVDKKTGLPNRDRVDAMMARLEKQGLLPSHFTCMCFQFTSLNHLSREYGYSVGNHVLRDFAGLVAALGTEESFIGSNGAGQIVGFFRECNAVKAEAILEVLDEQIQEYNSLNPDYAIEYRAASATSDDEKEFNIRDLLRCAFKKLRDANKPQSETAHETV